MPINIGQFLKATANLGPAASGEYLNTKIQEALAKNQRLQERAHKAAWGRWHPGEAPPGIAAAGIKAVAARIARSMLPTRERVKRWIANSPIRQAQARHAAQVRWAKARASSDPAASIGGEGCDEHKRKKEPKKENNRNLLTTTPLTPQRTTARGAAAGAVDEGNPAATTGAGVAGHQGRIARLFRRKIDPRFDPCRERVLKHYAEMNPDFPECPWGSFETKTLKRLLAADPEMTVERFQRCLDNRKVSRGFVRTDPPGFWLLRIRLYLPGPLNFKKDEVPPKQAGVYDGPSTISPDVVEDLRVKTNTK
jgi:hypothetical protein